jgi:hypothetical protein
MRFKDRNFPHPVLDPAGRDVADSAFQVTRSIKSDKTALYVHVEFALNNETLTQLISEGRAAFVVHADCNAAFFRKVYFFNGTEGDFTVPLTDIKRELGLSFFICATTALSDYTIKGMDALYGDTKFQLNKGDVLAYAEPVTEHIWDKDSLNKISSILLVREGATGMTVPCVTYGQEKIEATLPPSQYTRYGQFKAHAQVKATLLTAVVLPVLVEAVQKVIEAATEEENEEANYSSYLWFRVLRHRMSELSKNPGIDPQSAYSLAQGILEGVSDQAMREVEEILTFSE